MRILLAATLSAAVLIGTSVAAQPDIPHYGTWGVDLSSRDAKVPPGADFFMAAQGGWYAKAQIPADQDSTGVGYEVFNRAQDQLRGLIEAAAKTPSNPVDAQIGALFSAFMDEARVEQLDATPLQADLDRIAAIRDKADFTKLMAASYGGFGSAVISLEISSDAKRPDINMLYIGQSGLGLPDRDYYLTPGFKAQKDAYRAYIEHSLSLIGYERPADNAKAVLAFEDKIAKASWAAADRREIDKVYNPLTPAQLNAYAPQLDWGLYLNLAGAADQTMVALREKSAIQRIAKIYGETPIETLKAWQAFHVTDQAAPYLSKRFVDNRFAFTKVLTGVETQRPRWKRGVALIDGSLGEALGRTYVERYFPADSKTKMQDLVANLKSAMASRIDQSSWMSPSTKQEAKKKLAKMDVQVGYPDKWRDYAALKIDQADLYGDLKRSAAFEWAYQLSDLGKPVDQKKWEMTPQTVNAYNGELQNKVVFPAGILQPPYFDPMADPAVNYGAIGAVIGHEITHGFDDQGRKIDDSGKLRDWWTAEDAKRFQVQAALFGKQYDGYEGAPGMHINGKLTMGENIADLGGLLIAIDAYHASLHGAPAPVLDGLTGDQRLFLAYAQSWQEKDREDMLKQQMASDPHSPSNFRVIGPTRNIDAWYEAFDVKTGTYYLPPERRVRIW
jgi:putative endopeptidase